MGLRFRKSINLGGGFRVNISKSGIGYSWGVKGFRITKTARGSIRTTSSIPGTGISYSKEFGRGQHSPNSPSNVPSFDSNHYGAEKIANENISEIYSAEFEDVIKIARHKIAFNKIINFLMITSVLASYFSFLFSFSEYETPRYYSMCFLVIFIISLILKIYIMTLGRIKIDYEIDSESQQIINSRLRPLLELAKSQRLTRIVETRKVINKKYESGASDTVTTKKCKFTTNIPFPFKVNIPAPTFKMGKEKLVFLPDKLLIMKGLKIGIVNYTDINVRSSTTRFIEKQRVPKDTTIVDYTWRYVNKSGGPDRRFNNNPRYPVCLYGEFTLKSASGLNTVIMYSNGSPSIVGNLNNLNKPFSYFEQSYSQTETSYNNPNNDAVPNDDNTQPKKYPLRISMMFWCIISTLWGLFLAVDEAFLIEKPSLVGGLILLVSSSIISHMFYVLARSPKHNRYLFGKEFGMTKPVFVALMLFASTLTFVLTSLICIDLGII